ncbi:MATE family efflux transporter [Ferrimonas futtsuensis]|uniref:MATE family efflux transporter n=1 Tax=Ferrimonas futtsuensis TaxID=364764 RepID=UPI00041274DA|nr:MATE family efflux transporter [Ferrimonas futtsuensis]
MLTPLSRSLASQLFRMTLPMIVGVLSIMSYQLVDSVFIGRLGVQPLAALGFTIPVYQLIIGIQVGVGIATTAVSSRVLGEGDESRAKEIATLVLALGALTILALCIAIWVGQEAMYGLLGAQPELFPVLKAYWLPWLMSAWIGAMLYFGDSLYRSYGQTKRPGAVMVLTSVLNLVLDPLFIFTLDMGIAGAAWATICALGVGCIIIFRGIIANGWLSIRLSLGDSLANASQLTRVMLPATTSQFIPPVAAMAATALVAGFGENVVAAWGLGSRIELFSIVVVLALTMALPPMVGRLRGRGEFHKIRLLVNLSMAFVALWQLLVALAGVMLSFPISLLMANDPQVAVILASYLNWVPLSFGALGICMVLVSVANALGKPARALLISALRLLGCYLPGLWLGAELGGEQGLFIGAMIGNFAAGIMSWVLYRGCFEQMQSASRFAVANSGRCSESA